MNIDFIFKWHILKHVCWFLIYKKTTALNMAVINDFPQT